MAKREFLMLAHKYNSKKHYVGGWYVSEKLDGMRCFWDGGITRGMDKKDVPWANTAKDARYKTKQIATGLWSRYGNVIHAPDSWLDMLPKMFLDGELYGGLRQDLMSTVKKLVPNESDWKLIKLYCFDSPNPNHMFKKGKINTTNFKKHIDCVDWVLERCREKNVHYGISGDFSTIVRKMDIKCFGNAVLHSQFRIPYDKIEAEFFIEEQLQVVLDHGGEGLVLRKDQSTWEPERSHNLLKYKPFEDDEGIVVGCTTGRQTELGSKLLGKMGALILQLKNGKTLELSGFTDEERTLLTNGRFEADAYNWACENPECECPDWIQPKYFPKGCKVSFHFRGLSKDGIPQEARYWRKRGENE